jgi:hypothetical protein
MKLIEKLYAKKREIEDRYLSKEEQRLKERLTRAKEVAGKKATLSKLRAEISQYEPKKAHSTQKPQGFGMSFLQNAGKVSLLGTPSKPSGKKGKQKKALREFDLGFRI